MPNEGSNFFGWAAPAGQLPIRILYDTSDPIVQVHQTLRFKSWFEELRDLRARARIQARIDRLGLGNPGDVRPVGSGVSELRIDYGPGYRVYFVQRGEDLIVLLAGGKKATQARDIAQAITLASEF